MSRRAFANEAAVMAASFPQYRDACLQGAPHSSNQTIAAPVIALCMEVGEKRGGRSKGIVV